MAESVFGNNKYVVKSTPVFGTSKTAQIAAQTKAFNNAASQGIDLSKVAGLSTNYGGADSYDASAWEGISGDTSSTLKANVDIPGTKTEWNMDGLAGLLGTDAKTLGQIGSGIGSTFDIASGLYDMYAKNKAAKAAEEEAAYQRSVSQEKLALARQDRAEFRGYRDTNTSNFNNAAAMTRNG